MSCLFGTLNVTSHVKKYSTQLDLAVGIQSILGNSSYIPPQLHAVVSEDWGPISMGPCYQGVELHV